MAMRMPYFSDKNLTKFHFWCAIAHRQDFMPVYEVRANMLMLGRAGAPQSIKHIDACYIHGETNVTWWHGSRRSHRDDCAHKIAWICTYSNYLGHIPTLQGQKHSRLEMIAHIATRVHHKVHNLPYTRIYGYTYIMHNAITYSKKVKQTLPTSQRYSPTRYKKCKINIAIPKERGLRKEQER